MATVRYIGSRHALSMFVRSRRHHQYDCVRRFSIPVDHKYRYKKHASNGYKEGMLSLAGRISMALYYSVVSGSRAVHY